MKDFTTLYDGNGMTLSYAREDNDVIVFKVQTSSYTYSGLDVGFSGAAYFLFTEEIEEKYCKKLSRMYETLSGECLIMDCEFGNELKLYFEGRQLKIEVKAPNSDVCFEFEGDVDQTIIPPIISMLKNY